MLYLGRKLLFITLVFIYILYDIYLSTVIFETFYYQPGFFVNLDDIDKLYLFISIIISLFPSIFINIYTDKPSGVILAIIYLFHIIPTIILTVIIRNTFSDIIWILFISLSFSIFIIFYNIAGSRIIPFFKIKELGFFIKKLKMFDIVIIFLSIVLLIYLLLFFDLSKVMSISIFDVYKIRWLYKEQVSSLPLLGYLSINIGYIFSPFLILYGYTSKNRVLGYYLVFMGILLSLLIFSGTGFKSVAFMWVVIIFLFFFFRKTENSYLAYKFNTMLILSLLILHLLGLIIHFDYIFLHWIRRLIVSPGMNSVYFYDFMINKGIHSLANAPNVISNYYYHTDGSANTGIIGDGLSRYWILGIYFNYIVLFFILNTLDRIYIQFSHKSDKAFFLSLSYPIAYALSNSRTTTIILTYGFLLFIILMYGKLHKNGESGAHNYRHKKGVFE